jgi:hypothetical protein
MFFNGLTSWSDKRKLMGSEWSDKGKQTQQNIQHLPDNAAFDSVDRVFLNPGRVITLAAPNRIMKSKKS